MAVTMAGIVMYCLCSLALFMHDVQGQDFTFTIAATSGPNEITETEAPITLSVTVTRTCAAACPATQMIAIQNDQTTPSSATLAIDYTAVAEVLTFSMAETQKSFDVTILGDAIPEECEENFFLYLTQIDGAALGNVADGRQEFKIIDNDRATSATYDITSADNFNLPEGDADIDYTFTVNRICAGGFCPCTSVSVQLETRGSSATTSVDYVNLIGASGEVTFGAGNEETVTLTILGDNLPEIDEKFDVAIQSIGGVATTATNDAVERITILDDDIVCTIVDNGYSEREVTPAAPQPITVERNGGFSKITTCKIVSKNDDNAAITAISPGDYNAINQIITFQAKVDPSDSTGPQSDSSVEATVVNDNEAEVHEKFLIYVDEVAGVAVPMAVRVYVDFDVLDDDAQIGFETVDYKQFEGEECGCDSPKKGVCVTITRTEYTGRPATIELRTDLSSFSNQDLAESDDFEALTGDPFTFGMGVNQIEVCIELTDDKEFEEDEVFRISIENADGLEDISNIGGEDRSKAYVTIRNNDAEICIDSTPDYSILEGNTVTVYFTREGYLDREASFTVKTVDGTATESDNDYEPLVANRLVTFSSGQSRTSVQIVTDATDYYEETDEVFTVEIPDADNQVEDIGRTDDNGPSTTVATSCIMQEITIMDDDAKIYIVGANNGKSQPESQDAVITFSREEGYIDREQTFRLRSFDKNDDNAMYQALAGTNCRDQDSDCDFEDLANGISVTFPIGETETDVQIQINDDIYQENDEMFGVMIMQDPTSPEDIDTTRDEIKVTIEDDDAVIYVKDFQRDNDVAEYKEYEHNGPIVVIIGREGDLNREQTVYLRTAEITGLEGKAQNSQDYVDATGTRVTFAIGMDTAEAEVILVNDESVELTETFIVSIFSDNEDVDTTRDQTIVTILDDDAKCTIQSPNPRIIMENVGANDGGNPTQTCFTIWRRGYLGREGSCFVKTLSSDSAVQALNLPNNGELTAVPDEDYYSESEEVTFAVDVASDNTQFCVELRDDDDCELPENVYAVIDNPPGTFDKYTQASYFTIMDDEPESFLFLSPFSWDVVESAGYILVKVYRCGDITQQGSCRLRFDDGSAVGTSGRRKRQDYAPPATEAESILVFPPYVWEMEFNITIYDNSLVSGSKTFLLVIEGITGTALPGSIAGTVNIIDDDSFYFIELPYYSVEEDDTLTVRIIRNSNYLGNPGTVDISTSSLIDAIGGDISSGAAGLDFELLTNMTVNFGANEDSEDVQIPIGNDAISEFSELFQVSLSNPDGALYEDVDTSIVTIKDDDAVYYQFQAIEYRLSENAGTVRVQLERYGSLEEDGRVRIEFKSVSSGGLEAAQSPQDFVATDAWIEFPAGDHTAEASFRVVNDNTREDIETFGMFLTETENGELLNSPKDDATVFIVDDDDNPLITYSMRQTGVTVDETESVVELYVERISSTSYLPPGRAYIGIEERADSARLNQDFAVDDLVAYFGDGETEAKVTINIIYSPEEEPTEIFTAVLERVEGGQAVLGFPTRTDITILDQSVVFSFAGNTVGYSVSESQRSLSIRIQRSGNSENSASVGIVSVSGTATDDEDYDTVNSRVTFDRGETAKDFTIYVTIDDDIEGPETLTLVLGDPSAGAVLGANNQVTITIIDSTYRPPTVPPPDRSVCYSLGERTYNIDEDDGKVYFTITRSGPGTDEAGRVRFRTDSGSATPGQDYLSKETQVYFPEGNIQQVIYVYILDYDGKEDLEFFTVQLSDPEGPDPSLCSITAGGITAATVNINDVNIQEGLALGIIIAIAVAGIVLLLLFMAFMICICFRAPPRERENVIMMRRKRQEPEPVPVPLPQPQSFLVMQPEPEEEEPEEVVRVIRRVRVPYHVDGPPPPGYPSGQGPLGGQGVRPSSYSYGPPPPPYARQAGPSPYRSGLF